MRLAGHERRSFTAEDSRRAPTRVPHTRAAPLHLALACAVLLAGACGETRRSPSTPGEPPSPGDLRLEPAGPVVLGLEDTHTVTVAADEAGPPGTQDVSATSSDPDVVTVSPDPGSDGASFTIRAVGQGEAVVTFRDDSRDLSRDLRVTVTAADEPPRPNPARFFTKIGGDARVWDRGGEAVRDAVARYSDLVFVGQPFAEARAIASDLGARAARVGNADLRVLRYWNMWTDYNPQGEARYTPEMLLHQNWPDSNPTTRGPVIASLEEGGCVELVDVSSPALRAEIARVVRTFMADFDGVFFDRSSWNVYAQRGRGFSQLVSGACVPLPFGSFGVTTRFVPGFPQYALDYHAAMQAVIDPSADGRGLQLCNGLPRRPQDDANAVYEDRYLGVLDGCQMDPTFVDAAGRRLGGEDWLFELETLRRLAGRGKYFLAKVTWRDLPEPLRTDPLEYGLARYLLGTDGSYALFMPAYDFTDWERDAIVSAPLGAAAGDARPVQSAYVYVREFRKGLVYVNAGDQPGTLTLPSGSYRNVCTGEIVSGSLTLPPTSARMLVRRSG